MTHIHLDQAFWCENCQCIIDQPECCPSCATTINIQSITKAKFMKSHGPGPTSKLIRPSKISDDDKEKGRIALCKGYTPRRRIKSIVSNLSKLQNLIDQDLGQINLLISNLPTHDETTFDLVRFEVFLRAQCAARHAFQFNPSLRETR